MTRGWLIMLRVHLSWRLLGEVCGWGGGLYPERTAGWPNPPRAWINNIQVRAVDRELRRAGAVCKLKRRCPWCWIAPRRPLSGLRGDRRASERHLFDDLLVPELSCEPGDDGSLQFQPPDLVSVLARGHGWWTCGFKPLNEESASARQNVSEDIISYVLSLVIYLLTSSRPIQPVTVHSFMKGIPTCCKKKNKKTHTMKCCDLVALQA